MSAVSRLCLSGLAFGLLAASALTAPSQAQVTPEQATALQKQLQDWVAGVVGPTVSLPPLPLKFIPEGDHFLVQMDLAGVLAGSGVTMEGGAWTATARPLDGKRWAIDNVKVPSPLKIINASGPPELQGNITVTIAEQEAHSIFDPALVTTGSYDGRARGFSQVTEGPLGKGSTTIASITSHSVLQPRDGGRQDLLFESTAEGISSTQPVKDGPPATVEIDRLRQTGHIDGVDFAAAGTFIRSAMMLGKLQSDPAHKPGSTTPAERDAGHAMVQAVSGLLGLIDGDQVMEGMRVKAAGFSGKLAKLTLGGGFGAPKGESEMHLRFSVEGIESPDLPPGPIRDFVPRRVGFSPRMSGIPKDDLVKLLTTAVDSANGDMAKASAEGLAILAKSPVTVGIDDLILDIGVAKLTGSGEMEVTSPTEITGEAELRLTGFDALLKKVSAVEETKLAAPVLIFLKGIGEQDGKELVWTVKYEDSKVTVNGTDLTSMIPKGK